MSVSVETIAPAFRKDTPMYIFLLLTSIYLVNNGSSHLHVFDPIINLASSLPADRIKTYIELSFVLIPALVALSTALQTFFTSYELDNDRIVYHSGLLVRTSDSIEVYRIKDITVHASILDMILQLKTLTVISTDRTIPILRISGISSKVAEQLEPALREATEKAKEVGKGQEIDFV